MNFKKAYEEMLKGKKVRRLGWGGYCFIKANIIREENINDKCR